MDKEKRKLFYSNTLKGQRLKVLSAEYLCYDHYHGSGGFYEYDLTLKKANGEVGGGSFWMSGSVYMDSNQLEKDLVGGYVEFNQFNYFNPINIKH